MIAHDSEDKIHGRYQEAAKRAPFHEKNALSQTGSVSPCHIKDSFSQTEPTHKTLRRRRESRLQHHALIPSRERFAEFDGSWLDPDMFIRFIKKVFVCTCVGISRIRVFLTPSDDQWIF